MSVGDDCPEPKAGLLDSFPNLKSLPPLDPGTDWTDIGLQRVPPEVQTGTLGNGLTYFVQENREPKARAELYLAVGFGSLVEEEEERGIAHIIEHLGFSATKSYENHAIIKFLESVGAPFGACQNAYTSFDRTVYTLHIPTDKEGLVKESLTVLREFGYFTRISDEDLDKERKVVLEEWRESRNAQGRLFERYITALCKGCKWCERLPIGKEEVIMGAPSETLRSFYRRYYHPARMAVIAVGDFDGAEIVSTIRELFDIAPEDISPLARDPTPPERPRHAVPDTEGVEVASSTDSELSFAQGIVDCKRARQDLKHVQGFRQRLTEELFHKALSSRLLKLLVEPKGPRNFFMVSTETGEPIPPLNPLSINFAPLPGRMRPALRSIITEIERVKRMGFHEAEVVRAKRSILAEYEEEYIERQQRPSEAFAEQYCSLFLDDTPASSVEHRARMAACVIPLISCSEVSRVAEQFHFENNVVVKIATPPLSLRNPLYSCWSLLQACWNLVIPTPRLDLPVNSEVAEIVGAVKAEVLEQWPADEDDVDLRLRKAFEASAARNAASIPSGAAAATQLCKPSQAPGVPRPIRGTSLAELLPVPSGDEAACFAGEEVVLGNGLRIFIKPTDLFEDEIVLRARRWGGLSEHQAKGCFGRGIVSTEAQVCSMVAMMLGICGLSVESLQECLDGKRVEPNPPNLEAYFTGLDGHSSPADLEALLMLLNLLFLCPVDPGGKFRSRLFLVKVGLLAWRLGENRDPQSLFRRRVQQLLTGDHPYSRLPSLWSILRLNFSRASAIFNEAASRPSEWTFVLVGRLPPRDSLLPMLEKYLGSIPDSEGCSTSPAQRRGELEARQAVTPLEVTFPSKSMREEVKLKMVDPKGSTVLCYPLRLAAVAAVGDQDSVEADLRELFRLRLLVRMLETRLVETLRFKRGQVYGVSVSDDFSLAPPHLGRPRHGTLSVSFECDPAESNELIEATKTEFEQLRDGTAALTQENVTAALEQERREFEELFHKNDWWAGTILDLYFSRTHAVTGDIGSTLALWWRVRQEVVSDLDPERANAVLQAAVPKDATCVIATMRPRGQAPAGGGRGESKSAEDKNK